MFRRHWFAILIVASLGYFGLAAMPTLAAISAEQQSDVTLAAR